MRYLIVVIIKKNWKGFSEAKVYFFKHSKHSNWQEIRKVQKIFIYTFGREFWAIYGKILTSVKNCTRTQHGWE